MRKITSFSMGEQLDGFVQRMIESGRYGSTSEVMRSALRLLEQQENQDEAIRNAVIDGLNSGKSSLTLRDIAEQRKRQRISKPLTVLPISPDTNPDIFNIHLHQIASV
ncbi:type II toxin-antitoxin system ParD family antitoxin [Xenorhabdus nematophila]|uniref:Antitoxin ParD n=1 Tax=Xenorhabdus nematophila (strain ATCC 19061 / DSM 3370 / CCUG 14189 / LMG 1036 / NCIMB 9965 / AN6) TaxID=406817 RepID=D3VG91_XENNA|nr:type II toxin-antitoxin system ParD family antitoxin [Xenorhabdus nematophila]CBJ88181.1 conserved hypothetical protein [Xenorhabdus nematophila ATCC 19061]CCW30355.1 conserved hypothetical protein [Xenorhabdus nematophila F1]CEE94190.1 conserved hypothetical protein [Xenorhabdus nematophila str. Anatoliense]CEF30980.1 conserved hypothetical protein [Xenorhabdus nematophila str. Websteri]CEK21099.1 conserved hypothetical protein [Xenorhabdus nematophila AN6/1]